MPFLLDINTLIINWVHTNIQKAYKQISLPISYSNCTYAILGTNMYKVASNHMPYILVNDWENYPKAKSSFWYDCDTDVNTVNGINFVTIGY